MTAKGGKRAALYPRRSSTARSAFVFDRYWRAGFAPAHHNSRPFVSSLCLHTALGTPPSNSSITCARAAQSNSPGWPAAPVLVFVLSISPNALPTACRLRPERNVSRESRVLYWFVVDHANGPRSVNSYVAIDFYGCPEFYSPCPSP